ETLARRGTPVVLCDIEAKALEEVRRKIGAAAWAVSADVTKSEDVERMAAEARSLAGPIGGLVNCAGIYPVTPLLDLSVEEWDRVMAVNLRAPFLVTQAVARRMIADGAGGSIVNVSSTSSRLARPGVAHYGASKAALNQLTAVAAVELAPHGIRVNAILPGVIGTERVQATAVIGEDARAEHAAKLPRIPPAPVREPRAPPASARRAARRGRQRRALPALAGVELLHGCALHRGRRLHPRHSELP